MRDSCIEHDRYNVGCPACYKARVDSVVMRDRKSRESSAICPACQSPAEWEYREEPDAAGYTIHAFLRCTKCGTRSREVISFDRERKELEKEWPQALTVSELHSLIHIDEEGR